MREKKFRACISPGTVIIFTLEDLVDPNPCFSIRELVKPWLLEGNVPDDYIGLKDKNGKEIYEKDIVRYPRASGYDNHITIALVEWDDEKARFQIRFRDYPEHHLSATGKAKRLISYEVIGNVHENSELIRESK